MLLFWLLLFCSFVFHFKHWIHNVQHWTTVCKNDCVWKHLRVCLCVSVLSCSVWLPKAQSQPDIWTLTSQSAPGRSYLLYYHYLIFVWLCVIVCVCVYSFYTHITSALHHHHHFTPSELNSAVCYHQVIRLAPFLSFRLIATCAHTSRHAHARRHTLSRSLGSHSGKANIDDRSAAVKENGAVMTFITHIISCFFASS